MAEQENVKTVMVEGVECYLFPVPLDTLGDPLKDAEFFLGCADARLYALKISPEERSREMSLAHTNVQQACHWFNSHTERRRMGIPLDQEGV